VVRVGPGRRHDGRRCAPSRQARRRYRRSVTPDDPGCLAVPRRDTSDCEVVPSCVSMVATAATPHADVGRLKHHASTEQDRRSAVQAALVPSSS
jgi:hypothetical protein